MSLFIILVGGLLVIALTGVPIGAGLGLMGILILAFVVGGAEDLAVTAVWNVFSSFTMSALPAFIIMGEILLASGLSKRIYASIEPLFRRLPGGLLHTNIAMSCLFGSVAGSSTATAAAVGSVAYPALRDRGYDKPAIVGTLTAGGTLGLLIPPSVVLLIYGAMMNLSIGKLFLAGILPSVVMALLFVAVILWKVYRNPAIAPVDIRATTFSEKLAAIWQTWPIVLLFLVVIGSIVLGLATATESAAVGVVMAIVLGFLCGDLTPRLLWKAFISGMIAFGGIGLIVVGALILAQAISLLGLPQLLMAAVTQLQLGPYQMLAVVVVTYLLLGCFFDGLSLMLMTVPLAHPMLVAMGFDPIWIGIIVIICIEIAMITPPVGMNLFVITAVTKNEVSIATAATASVPYFLVILLGIVILTIFPQIVLFLPGLM